MGGRRHGRRYVMRTLSSFVADVCRATRPAPRGVLGAVRAYVNDVADVGRRYAAGRKRNVSRPASAPMCSPAPPSESTRLALPLAYRRSWPRPGTRAHPPQHNMVPSRSDFAKHLGPPRRRRRRGLAYHLRGLTQRVIALLCTSQCPSCTELLWCVPWECPAWEHRHLKQTRAPQPMVRGRRPGARDQDYRSCMPS